MRHAFKIRNVERRGMRPDGKTAELRVLLHPIDPHEAAVGLPHDLHREPYSGGGQIKLTVSNPSEIDDPRWEEGNIIEIAFE
jgi:hypothetical protein